MEYDATIIALQQETPDTKTFRLDVGGQPLVYLPGQFVMITAQIEGKPVTRAFSISSSPLHSCIDITIKAEPTGYFSKFANTQLQVGDVLKIRGPHGHFTFTGEEQGDLLFIAAGSGIAPFRSMLQYIFEKKLPHKITLLFSNKTSADIIFKKEFEQYAQQFPQFTFLPIVTREQGWNGYTQRVDSAFLQRHLHANTLCYLCGPPLMVNELKEYLIQLGVGEERIKIERYG